MIKDLEELFNAFTEAVYAYRYVDCFDPDNPTLAGYFREWLVDLENTKASMSVLRVPNFEMWLQLFIYTAVRLDDGKIIGDWVLEGKPPEYYLRFERISPEQSISDWVSTEDIFRRDYFEYAMQQQRVLGLAVRNFGNPRNLGIDS